MEEEEDDDEIRSRILRWRRKRKRVWGNKVRGFAPCKVLTTMLY